MRPARDPLPHPDPFVYPAWPMRRRHGPRGYPDDSRCKPFLRDEFDYRCVYCLCRERWYPNGANDFGTEHLLPVSLAPAGPADYDTLAYSCCDCNSARGNHALPLDPCLGLGRHLEVREDGTIHALDLVGAGFIRICGLDRGQLTRFRRHMRTLLAFLASHPEGPGADLCRAYLSYPDDLPDLSVLRPPEGNSRLGGIAESAFARRQRGELPGVY